MDSYGLPLAEGWIDGFCRGSSVTVYGRETRRGIVCCLPPHLVEGGADKVSPVDQMYVDLGMDAQEAKALVSPGIGFPCR